MDAHLPTSRQAAVAAAWRNLQRDWQSDDAHRRFLSLCAQLDALDQAGRLYREVRDADVTRREEATRRLGAVLMLAMEQLSAARSPRSRRQRRVMWLLVGACGFILAHAILALLRA